MTQPLDELPGIGPVTRSWLEDTGIATAEELRALGAVEAWRRLKFMMPNRVNLNALYALEAATGWTFRQKSSSRCSRKRNSSRCRSQSRSVNDTSLLGQPVRR